LGKHISIAVDGPSAAGKSTLSRRAAERFGIMYIDTGALYRTAAYGARLRHIAPSDEVGVSAILPALDIELKHSADGVQRMYLDGTDVSDEIRLPEISIYASDISAMSAVRAFLLDTQRNFAEKYDVIMDGRDIGTVVLPDAGLKIFLTASPETRALRRLKELNEKGVAANYEDVLRDIKYRDENDSKRANAPLKAAADAVMLDTGGLDFEQSEQKLFDIISKRFGI